MLAHRGPLGPFTVFHSSFASNNELDLASSRQILLLFPRLSSSCCLLHSLPVYGILSFWPGRLIDSSVFMAPARQASSSQGTSLIRHGRVAIVIAHRGSSLSLAGPVHSGEAGQAIVDGSSTGRRLVQGRARPRPNRNCPLRKVRKVTR